MEMDMHGDPAVANLPISDPKCNSEDCIAFAAAANSSQEITPWAGQFEYGHWTTWYYLIMIVAFMVVYGLRSWVDHKAAAKKSGSTTSSRKQKLVAMGRYLAYRRIKGRAMNSLELPSTGLLALLLLTVGFLAALTFVARPYYREHEGYGAPPIAIRTGLMAFACTPILVALAGKASTITLLTGVSHEKLNVIHRWTGWITLVLSLIHTIPFFYAPLHDVGYTNLHSEFYGTGLGGATMYSGVPALAILVGLVFLSIPYIRHRVYEAFYYTHILMAITYLGLLFWHAANLLDSWAYLWAALALWLASYLARAFHYTRPMNLQNEWLSGAPTTIQALPGDMTRIEVLAPLDFRHTPAQHCFLRFPSISALDNHPFTIVSAPAVSKLDQHGQRTSGGPRNEKLDVRARPLLFLARTHAGFTRRLASYCANNPDAQLSAWIDGPYGGIRRPVEHLFDDLIIVAGGSGITACLPWLTHIAEREQVRVRRVLLRWIMKDEAHIEWAGPILKEVLSKSRLRQNRLVVDLKFYVTQNPATDCSNPGAMTSTDVVDKVLGTPQELKGEHNLVEVVFGRPSMKSIVSGVVGSQKSFIIGCGPESLRTDLGNAVAAAQSKVWMGEAQDIALHLEAFGW